MKLPSINQDYYKRIDVNFEITKQTLNREFALLIPEWCTRKERSRSVRMLKMHNTKHFNYLLRELKFFREQIPYNFYYSLASYTHGIPNQTMNLASRKPDNEEWKKVHENYMKGYDLLIDIDIENHKDVHWSYRSAQMIKEFFDKHKFPYVLKFSGRGFHFITPSFYLPTLSFDSKNDTNIYTFCATIARKLRDRFTELIDCSIYDPRRLCKLAYSLALYENSVYICYPFHTEKEFENFKLSDHNIKTFSNSGVCRRGNKIFNENHNINKVLKELKINWQDF